MAAWYTNGSVITIPVMVGCAIAAVVTTANGLLGSNDFLFVVAHGANALLAGVTGIGVQGGGPTPCVAYNNVNTAESANDAMKSLVATGSNGNGLAPLITTNGRPIMAGCDMETGLSDTELLNAAQAYADARTWVNSPNGGAANNPNTNRQLLCSFDGPNFDTKANNCFQQCDWVVVQGQTFQSNVTGFDGVVSRRITDARNINRNLKIAVEVSCTRGDSAATVKAALDGLSVTPKPDALHIFAALGVTDWSTQLTTLYNALKAGP